MFSRSGTGLMAATATGAGTSDFGAGSGFEFAEGPVELAPAAGEVLPAAAPVALTAVVVPTGFELGVAPEAGFTVEVLTGFAVLFAVAGPTTELGAGAATGFGAGGVGLATEVVAGAGFEAGVTPEVAFGAEVLAGLGLAFAAADPTVELGAGAAVGLAAGAAGFTAEVVGGAGFGVCGLGAAVPAGAAWLPAAVFAPTAALAGAG